ncbi:MAG: TonB-dependent receptor plug domain-containing protein [Verrucomicrobia bacterium]|nr:TonB-dependent receptor plug domain-containing protein [Verrucomicrobiota bacterium]
MNTNPKHTLAALLAVLTAWPLTAQPVASAPPKPADDETITLTPFEVATTKDTGYQATETLAGTRIRTDLRDVGSAIQVVTKEFLKDVGATDAGTLLQYTTNTEVAGTRGTYTGLGNGTSVDESGNLRAPQGAQRVRGLAAADNARDFFVTDIPWDSYIVDRIDIQRGPNSILFGLGSPAGMVNAGLRNAEFRNFGSVDARFGSYGSARSTLDLNQQIIPKVLSLRLDGLWSNEKFRQEPAFQDDRRFYGALRFDPQLFKAPGFHTSIRAKFEHGDITANRPRTVTPNDNLSAWFRPSAVSATNPFGGMNKAAVNNGYDAWRSDAANIVAGDGKGMVIAGTVNYQPWLTVPANQQQPFWLIDGTTNQLYRVEGGFINVGARNNTGGLTGAAAGLIGKRTMDQFYGIAGLPQAAVALNLPSNQFGQYRQQSMLDSSIFDYNNTLIDGNTKSEWEHWNAYNLNLSQTFWRDRIGIDVAYDRQKYQRGGQAFFGGAPGITVDVLRNFADFYLSGANGLTTTNPNFGRPYVTGGGGSGGNSYRSDREYTRASIFGEVRVSDFSKNEFLIKLFGRHRFNGVYANEEYSTENLGWQLFANSREWAAFWNGTDGTGSPINDRPPMAFVYLGPSIANRTSAAGAAIPGVTANVTLTSAPVHVFNPVWTNNNVAFGANWDVPASLYKVFNGLPNPESTAQLTQASNPANYVGWTTFQNNLLSYDDGANKSLLTRAQLSKRETRSFAGSWQGYLWNDAIVPTLGWRFDEVKGKAINAPVMGNNRNSLNLAANVYTLPATYPANQIFKDHSTSGGWVVHLNRVLPRDPLPFNVSVSYNKSDNFQVTDTRRDLYGNPISNPTGKTKDYGVLLSTKDGKYSFRAVKYETSVKNASSGLSDSGGIGRVIQQGLRFRNVFLYKLGAYDWATREQAQARNTWGGSTAQGDAVNSANQNLTFAQGRALEDSAIRTWNEIQVWLTDKGFFNAWGFQPQPASVLTDRTTYEANPARYTPPNTAAVFAYVATPPPGFTVTADTESKGYEYEFTANPTRNWRISINASQTEAVRRNVGGRLLDEYIAYLDSKLTNADGSLTPAGSMPQFGNTTLNLYANVFGPWRSNYVQMKLQEGAAAPEIRKWRYGLVTNYSFREGLLKGSGIGGSYRWQDKVVIGYPTTARGSFDLTNPAFGPSEDAIDLWVNYERKLTPKIGWKIQLNIRNAFAKDGLIPISIEPDGKTWASVRVKPNQEWFVTNTFSF